MARCKRSRVCYNLPMSTDYTYRKYNGQQGCVAAVEARFIRKGDRFVSDRESEGEVQAAYDYGVAPYDDRPESVGVYPYPMEYGNNGWFIAIQPDWLVHLTYLAPNPDGE